MREAWKQTEECLSLVAGSMGELLTMIRPQISTSLLNGPGWKRLVHRAREIPATMAAFPFGFEMPLQDPEPRSDFGVSLVGNSMTANFFQNKECRRIANQSMAGLAWFLDETDRKDSLLRSVVGRKMLLEYDINLASNAEQPDPGIFIYPVDDILAGGGQRYSELSAVYDALVFASGWDSDSAERRQFQQLYEKTPSDIIVKAVGTFPSRQRLIRTTVTGFTKAQEVEAFLNQVGWPGYSSVVSDVVSYFDDCKAYAYLGIHFDVTASGIGPALGLSFFAQEKEWLKDIKCWTPVIDAIGERGDGIPEKLAELTRWAQGGTTLLTKSGPIMLVRGIHHIKLSITQDKIKQAKAYVFFLMMTAVTNRTTPSQ